MIVLINPNSTVSMTDAMVRTAQDVAPGVKLIGWTSHQGPPAIQGAEDGAASVPPLLELVAKACELAPRGVIIGCFDDTGLAEARAIAGCPVIGIGQAAYHMAVLAGERFSVVTTLAVSVPILEENIRRYGLSAHLGRVRASGVAVHELEHEAETAALRVLDEIRAATEEDDVQSIVLGCAGMVELPARAAEASHLRIIDGVRAAVQVAATL